MFLITLMHWINAPLLRWVRLNLKPRARQDNGFDKLRDAREIVAVLVIALLVLRHGFHEHPTGGQASFEFAESVVTAPLLKAPAVIIVTLVCAAAAAFRGRRVDSAVLWQTMRVPLLLTSLVALCCGALVGLTSVINRSDAGQLSSGAGLFGSFAVFALIAIMLALVPSIYTAAFLGMRHSYRAGELHELLPAWTAAGIGLWEYTERVLDVVIEGRAGLLIPAGPMFLRVTASFAGPVILLSICAVELFLRRKRANTVERTRMWPRQTSLVQRVDRLYRKNDVRGLRAMSAQGSRYATRRLADLYYRRKMLAELRAQAYANEQHAIRRFLALAQKFGNAQELQAWADAGHRQAQYCLGALATTMGRYEEALTLLRPFATFEPGVIRRGLDSTWRCVRLLARLGRWTELSAYASAGHDLSRLILRSTQ